MGRAYNIAQFGAFDINSLGDSMFPKVFETEIRKRLSVNSITLFSLNETAEPFNANTHVYSYEQFKELNSTLHFDAVVIGGGEFLNFEPIKFNSSNEMQKITYDPGLLWTMPIELANELHIPVIINGIGAAHDFAPEEIKTLNAYLSTVAYISVRDGYSAARLSETTVYDSVHEIADNLWYFSRHYPLENLTEIRNKLIDSKNWNLSKPYLVLQYGTTYKYREVALQAKKIKEEYELDIVLLPINYCHEDIAALESIEQVLGNDCKLLTDFLQPTEIMSIIAGASAFIGTSLHGNITAMSYGVKSMAVDMYTGFVSKIDGLFSMLELGEYVVPEPAGIFSTFTKLENDALYISKVSSSLSRIVNGLDKHFDNVADIIKSAKSKCSNIVEISPSEDSIIKCVHAEKFIKSFVEYTSGGMLIQKYQISKLNNDAYLFDFQFDETIDANLLQWSLVSNFSRCIKPLRSYTGNTEIVLKPISSNIREDGFVVSNDKKTTFKIISEGQIDHIYIEFSVQYNSLRDINELLLRIYNNQSAHIEQLIQIERDLKNEVNLRSEKVDKLIIENAELFELNYELEKIKSSHTWRLMLRIWRANQYIMPVGSRRRFLASIFKKVVKNPGWFIRKLSPKYFNKLIIRLKREGVSGVSERLNGYLDRPKAESKSLKINRIANQNWSDYKKIEFSSAENPLISIVIPVYNQFEYTYNCLESIKHNSGNINYEIIIANDCSIDYTTRIEEIVSGIQVINNKENLRFLKNCNNAANYAKGKYILFLNNDTQPQENWLEPLVNLVENDGQIGMVGSKLIYSDGRLQEAGGIIWKDGSAWNYGNLSNPNDPEYNYVKEVDYISGASIMIRTNLWNEIGGFDERYAPAYCEDSDLAFEVRKHGYKVVYQPLSVVVHFEGISNGTDLSAGQKAYQVENQKKLYEKWKSVLECEQNENGVNVYEARDRSRDKKTLLMVDHYVPQYDKDAGSRTVFQYLELFAQQGFNVKFIGDNFFPHQPYTAELGQLGVEVLYGTYYAHNWKSWVGENSKYIQFVFLNRPSVAVNYIDYIKEHTNAKIIYYGHDLHFLRERREYELYHDKLMLQNSKAWLKKEIKLMRKSDVVYYPSYVEVQEIHKIDSKISVKAIPAYFYDDVKEQTDDFKNRRDIMFIGGFSHRPNVDAVKWLYNQIYPIIQQKLPDMIIYIVGSNPPDDIKELNSDKFQIVGYVSDEELKKYYQQCRMSVVPLRYGAGIKGKVVEAMYNGTPVVTTSVGAEGLVGTDDIFSIADDAQSIANMIIELYNDPTRLANMSKKSFEYIKDNFSSQNALKVIGNDFGL